MGTKDRNVTKLKCEHMDQFLLFVMASTREGKDVKLIQRTSDEENHTEQPWRTVSESQKFRKLKLKVIEQFVVQIIEINNFLVNLLLDR